MDSIKIGQKKQLSGEVQFFSNRQHLQQHSIQKLKNQEKKSNTKIVRFDSHIPTTKQQAFKNTAYNPSKTVSSNISIFEDHDITSSSINILANEVPIISNKPIFSVRATVVTFIIVILIISVTAIALGVVFGIIKSQKSSSGTTTKNNNQNNNQNSLSTVTITAIVSSVSIGSQSGAPCTSYTTINDPTRNVAQTGLYGTCDRGSIFNASNGGSWIRFVGSGGTTIPLTSPGMNHCGGYLAGWYNDTLPTTVGTVVNGSVCFEINLSSCDLSVPVSVINCGGFYVYFLLSLNICSARYCTT